MNDRRIAAAQGVIVAALLVVVLAVALLGGGKQEPGSGVEYAVPDDLNGQPLSVVTGSEYAEYAAQRFPDSKLLYVNEWTDAFMMVSQGKAEGMLTENTSIEEVYKLFPNLIALPEPLKQMAYSFVTQKNARGEALAAEFNVFLAQFKAGGGYEALHEKWLRGDITIPRVEPCASDGARGALRISTSDDWIGYCYVVDGENAGLFIDLCYRFCEWAGYAPQLDVVHFNTGFMGVVAGRYDMLAYGCISSEERAETVTFTDPLEGAELVALVRASAVAGGAGNAQEADEGGRLGAFFRDIVNSFEKNFISEQRWKMMLGGLGVTLGLAVFTAILGTVLGAVICYLYNSKNPFATGFARMYIKLFQGMPIVVLLLILFFVVFTKPGTSAFLVGVLGFSLDFAAYTADVFRTGINAVPPGQQRAALALGFGKFAAFRSVVLPQAMRHILPVYRGQFVAMVKNTAVAGYISINDLTRVSDIIRTRTYEAFFPIVSTAVIYFALAALLISGLKLIEIRTDPLRRGRMPKGVRP